MISIAHVSFGYTEAVASLHDISLQVEPGECILLCGGSGCGKTTVTKLINGLIPHFTPDCTLTGSITLDALDVPTSELYTLARRVGSVFQNPKSQFFCLDSDSELAFGLENQGTPPDEIRARLTETVRDLQLDDLLGRNIFAMSGGEKQTLAFASVYAMAPAVYVLDEPSANLDGAAIDRLHRHLAALKAAGHTILIAEHRLYFLADLIDRAVYLEGGRITHSFTGAEFRALTEAERIALGLRTLRPAAAALPPALPAAPDGLAVEGLTCAFGKGAPVFSGLSFGAKPGEVLGITGQNGVGKTTLSRCLCGLLRERAGSIRLDGRALAPRARIATAFCVMQDVNHQLFSDSVWGECTLAAPEAADEVIGAALARFDLLPLRESHPMALSGGQKQRLAVVTALLSDKRLLIFDEPTSGLDYAHMQAVADVVRGLAREGRIVLVITHDNEFLQAACDRVLRLQA